MRQFVVLLLLALGGCATSPVDSQAVWKVVEVSSANEVVWPLVAQSRIIVTGTLSVPVDEIRSRLATKQHEYVDLVVQTDAVLKGGAGHRLTVRWYTEPKWYGPDPEVIIGAHGRRVLLFLIAVDDPSVQGLYFAGSTPNALATIEPKMIGAVRKEIADQDKIVERFPQLFPIEREQHHEKVRSLIDATTRPDSQMAAFKELERLGPGAVPAIILTMDDRRDLAIPAISLHNNAVDAFESVRHYGPKKVVDAMDVVLNQLTGHGGSIVNGGSEAERQEAVRGWRIYLFHLKRNAKRA